MRHPLGQVVRHRQRRHVLGGQLRQRGVPIGHAVEPFWLAVVAEQARLLQQVLVIVQYDRVDIERDRILLAVASLRRLPVRLAEVARLDPRRREFFGGDGAQHVLRDAERHAQFVIGHHVGALADRRRGLNLAVEWHAPLEGRRVDMDFAVEFLVEFVEHGLHADAVAAAEEVPPYDCFGRARCAREQRGARQSSHRIFCGSCRFPPRYVADGFLPPGTRFAGPIRRREAWRRGW